MLSSQRHLFDIADDVAYLNCASFSPYLKTVHAAGAAALTRKLHPWTMDRDAQNAEADQARALFAGLINADAADIAIVPSTSYGVATAAANLAVAAGQSIVVLQDQFPSNYYAWKALAERGDGRLVTVPRPNDGDWTPAVMAAIDTATAIAALPNCHWTDGARLDLEAVGARCREIGAALVVDATQSVGALPTDVVRIRPDFLVCSAYKWLLCPYTLAFLYAAPHRQDGRPLELHYGNRAGATTQQGGTGYAHDFLPGAQRYDMGERVNIINLPMAIAAMTQLGEWGVDNIAASLAPLIEAVAEMAAARGMATPAAHARVGHFIGIRPPALPADIAERLAAERVYVSRRGDNIRVSPHLYNDMADIERLFTALDKVLSD